MHSCAIEKEITKDKEHPFLIPCRINGCDENNFDVEKGGTYTAAQREILLTAQKNYTPTVPPTEPYIPDSPIVIFADRHEDPATHAAMCSMLPYFEALGYKSFYEELPQGLNADHVISYMKKIADEKASKVSSLKPNDIRQQVTLDLMPRVLRHTSIGYKTIDALYPLDNPSWGYHGSGLQVRNNHMCRNYQAAQNPVFGRVGLAHVRDMQEILLRHNLESKELVRAKYLFVYVYSMDSKHEIETQVRTGRMDLPLGITMINAGVTTQTAIVDQIRQEIKARKFQLARLQAHRPRKISEQLETYLKINTSTSYHFFNQKIELIEPRLAEHHNKYGPEL